ncbi:MAG TPA: bifunctional DNA primase/polymerase [Jatrophihabitans sp.]|nr:bifunctional DNA primase/polymerase [Jatrophihabitans sp.]
MPTTDDLDRKAREYVQAVKRGDLGRQARLQDELDAATREAAARLDAPDALALAAVWYARRGVAVFPCKPRGKEPIVSRGLHAATTDVEQVRSWWQATPAANIGAPTGHLFDVIDLDGREAVLATYGAGVEFPPEIGHSLTAREAGHHVFIAPTGAGNRANIYPHVDYRGRGGYVILPPSVGANGKRYAWTRPLELDVQPAT